MGDITFNNDSVAMLPYFTILTDGPRGLDLGIFNADIMSSIKIAWIRKFYQTDANDVKQEIGSQIVNFTKMCTKDDFINAKLTEKLYITVKEANDG